MTENLRRLSIGKGGLVLNGSGMGIFLLLSVSSVRNREPSVGQALPNPILLATGIYFHAGPPAAATPPRTPGARLQSHCRRTPEKLIKLATSLKT